MDVMILHGDEPREVMHARLFTVAPGVDHYILPQQGHSLAYGLKRLGHLFPLVGHVLSGNMDAARSIVESAGGQRMADFGQAAMGLPSGGQIQGEDANADPA